MQVESMQSPGAASATARGVATTYLRGDDVPERTCSIEGCESKHEARGWCNTHYMRWYRNGSTEKAQLRDLLERLMEHVRVEPGGCWLWTGRCDSNGYGRFAIGSKIAGTFRSASSHRVAYELLVGPIPEGLQIDHLCRQKACVNPGHMEPVPQWVNILRGESFSAVNARKTHCIHGHLFDEANTYVWRGGRICRECVRQRGRKYRAREAA
jgi:hypothetical protein